MGIEPVFAFGYVSYLQTFLCLHCFSLGHGTLLQDFFNSALPIKLPGRHFVLIFYFFLQPTLKILRRKVMSSSLHQHTIHPFLLYMDDLLRTLQVKISILQLNKLFSFSFLLLYSSKFFFR